jgi:hypothetical protein
MPGEPGRAPPPTAVEVWPSVAPFGEAGRISVSIIVLAFLCSSAGRLRGRTDRQSFAIGHDHDSAILIGVHRLHLRQECVPWNLAKDSFDGGIRSASGAQLVRQLPPRDRSQFTAGGRIQPRAAIRPCAAAATDPMWTPRRSWLPPNALISHSTRCLSHS